MSAKGMENIRDKVVRDDCVKWLRKRREQGGEPFADLIFADPPFNIGYKYDVYEDRKAYDEYYAWTQQWMTACRDVLKPTGSFWVAIGDEYAAEVRLIGRELGLHLRNWIIWHYTFGQNTKKKFARSHTHLFYFVRDEKNFTFVDEAVRTFSDRQREYNDKRANEAGKLPHDVWTEFPRICGTFEEREGWHPCQMPETLLARIVRVCSRTGDLVFDPFAGSGTTLVVAKKLRRHYFGLELSGEYARGTRQRLGGTKPMADIVGERTGPWLYEHQRELCGLYGEMSVGTDKLNKNRPMLHAFARQLNRRLEASGVVDSYTVEEVWAELERLRKRGKLPRIRVYVTEPTSERIEPLLPNEERRAKGGRTQQGTRRASQRTS